MILYLRNETGKTIVDIELWTKTEYESDGDKHSFIEISCSIDIAHYSFLLLDISNQSPDKLGQAIADFSELSEIRGWMWENYFMVKKNTPEEYNGVLTEVRKTLDTIGKRYNLRLIED